MPKINRCGIVYTDKVVIITGIDIIISGGSELGYGIKYPLTFLEDKRK